MPYFINSDLRTEFVVKDKLGVSRGFNDYHEAFEHFFEQKAWKSAALYHFFCKKDGAFVYSRIAG